MSRNADSLRAAFDATTGTQAASQVQGFAPGHFVGFYLSIDKGGALLVSPGEANVGGQGVILKNTVTIEENAWALPRVAQRMYYVYLKRDGNFYVDGIDPTFVALYNGNYHPVTNYRYIGKVFNSSDGKLIYKLSDHNDTGTEVIVGASGFTGYMDYECDGEHDEDQINQAVQYVSESGVAATVVLRGGQFHTQSPITLRSNVTVRGDNAFVLISNGGTAPVYGIVGYGTTVAALENVVIDGIDVSEVSAAFDTTYLVYMEYTDNVRIQNCVFHDGCGGILIMYPHGPTLVTENVFRDLLKVNAVGDAQLAIGSAVGDDLSIHLSVSNNQIYNCCDGIGVYSGRIENNSIRNVYGRGASLAAEVPSMMIGNRAESVGEMYSTYPPQAAFNIGLGRNVKVANNMAVDCGTLMQRGDCEFATATAPFLYGATNDTNTNCTFAQTASTAYLGNYSYLFTKTAATGTPARTYFHQWSSATTGQMGSLGAGLTYKLTGYVYIPSGATQATANSVFFGMSSIASTSVTWTSNVVNTAAAAIYDAWQGISVSAVMHVDATAAMAYVAASSSSTQNATFYVDHLRIAPIGIHNEHLTQFSNSGTGTLETGNSWQNPFPV